MNPCQSALRSINQCALISVAGTSLKWRTETFCPLNCSAHSHYEPCASACPVTCANDTDSNPANCDVACQEGCVCDDGYVLDGAECIPKVDCGCTDADGNYYPAGTE